MSTPIYIIYKHTSKTSGKSYIGQTRNSISTRWIQHTSNAKNNTSFHFHRAIRKYGKGDFTHETLFTTTSQTIINLAETFLIAYYDSYKTGYNMTTGGSAFAGLSGKDNGMYGKTHTLEAKAIFSKTAVKNFKGKSYVDLYGEDKANELKLRRSIHFKELVKTKDLTGSNNPNSKRVSIRGIKFDTLKDAANHFDRSSGTLVGWIKRKDDCFYL